MHTPGSDFEQRVRAVARMIWDVEPGDGAPLMIDDRERDFVYFGPEAVHYVECTMWRTLDKVKSDASKLVAFRNKHSDRLVQLWIVTNDEPTAHQTQEARRHGIKILSLEEFAKQLFDGATYLTLRTTYAFGSAADLTKDSSDIQSIAYHRPTIHADGGNVKLEEIVESLEQGDLYVLTGDYGMGKSLMIRELFVTLAKRYKKRGVPPIPIAVNLREHWGQADPREMLQRHARSLGLSQRQCDQLVRAYNSRQLVILLDGFDEVASQPLAEKRHLTNQRREAVASIRAIIQHQRGGGGVIVAGREHFFDSRDELRRAFDLPMKTRFLSLHEFSEDEARMFLAKAGFTTSPPEWLPRRPLFLAYLVARGILAELSAATQIADPAEAWNQLLEALCRREARIHRYLDASSIRSILEVLADFSRETISGRGPIRESDMIEAFRRAMAGEEPDDTVKSLLMRLPGLSARNSLDGSREFLDDAILSALRAGTVVRFAGEPYGDPHASRWQHGLGATGLEVAEYLCRHNFPEGGAEMAAVAASEAVTRWQSPTLALDLTLLAMAGAASEEPSFQGLAIVGAHCQLLDLANYTAPANLTLDDITVDELILPLNRPRSLVIRNSLIGRITGASNANQVPPWVANCEIDEYDKQVSNAALMDATELPLGVRVLGTVLRKLFVQRGSCRQRNALYRGLGTGAREIVPQVLELVDKHGIAKEATWRGSPLWFPLPNARPRAHDILNSIRTSTDPLVAEARQLR